MIEGTITAKPQIFAAAVKWAAKFLAGRPAVPMQAGLLIEVNNGEMAITAYSEVITARAVVPVAGDGAGRAVVSGRLLDKLVATFAAKPVELRQDDGDALILNAGRWTGTLPTMPDEDFPDPPAALPVIGRTPGQAFASMVHRVGAARSVDDKQPIQFHLMQITFGADHVAAIASNSFRAACDQAPFEWDPDYEQETPAGPVVPYGVAALVMASTMVDVAEAFIGPDDVFVGLDGGSISLASATRSIVMRQTVDPYPMGDLLRGLFAKSWEEHAVVKVADLAEPLKRAALLRETDGPVRVRFGADLISIVAKADQLKQGGTEEVDAQYAGPETELVFNPKFFGDALASAPGETVDINLNAEKVAGVIITAPGNETWRHLLMPLKGR